MLFLLIFAVGVPLWLLAEEVMRLRASWTGSLTRPEAARLSKPGRVVLSRSSA